MKKPMELMIALDFSKAELAEEWMDRLGDLPVVFKVGYQLFLATGPDWVAQQTARGRRIFLDLKLYDIPNTVEKGVERACDLGVEFLTLHLSSGRDALEKSQKQVEKSGSSLCLLGVTVLTSFSEQAWKDLGTALGTDEISIQGSVTGLLNLARDTGVPGIVCSGWDLRDARKVNPDFFTVVPGIRPEGSSHQDQKRVLTPKEAQEAGARAIVMGRPIFEAPDPRKLVEEILAHARQ